MQARGHRNFGRWTLNPSYILTTPPLNMQWPTLKSPTSTSLAVASQAQHHFHLVANSQKRSCLVFSPILHVLNSMLKRSQSPCFVSIYYMQSYRVISASTGIIISPPLIQTPPKKVKTPDEMLNAKCATASSARRPASRSSYSPTCRRPHQPRPCRTDSTSGSTAHYFAT